MRKLLLFCVFCFFLSSGYAQDLRLGFQAGLNFNHLSGPLEKDGTGRILEEMTTNSGFQIGAVANYPLLDFLGLRGELLFTQLGGRYRYHGQSFLHMPTESGKSVLLTGNKTLTLNINNAYFYLPLSVYIKPIKQVELSAGAGLGFLIASTAVGQLRFGGITEGGQVLDTLEVSLIYNYLKDQTGNSNESIQQMLILDGESVAIPTRAGAYWLQARPEQGAAFNRWDFSLHAAIKLYLGQSLYLGGKIQYGLSDVSNDAFDYARYRPDADGQPIPRADKDTQLSYQIQVGFNF